MENQVSSAELLDVIGEIDVCLQSPECNIAEEIKPT
jgi:hypothetical protein